MNDLDQMQDYEDQVYQERNQAHKEQKMAGEKEVQLDEKRLARGNEFLHALQPYGQVQVVREMARRIQALDKNEIKLNGGEAAHLAQLAVAHDLNPFSGEIWGWVQVKKGERHFSWMPGRRGIIRHANQQSEKKGAEWWSDDRVLTRAEKAALFILEDAIAYECRVFESTTWNPWNETFNNLIAGGIEAKEALRLVGNPPSSSGIGVLTQSEIKKMPYGNKMPHANRAKKRALMEALKGKFSLSFGGSAGNGGGDTFEDYIVDSEGAIDVDFEDVTDAKPYGLDPVAFGTPEERMNPKYWKGIPKIMVEAELARDEFVAAELLAYSKFTPKEANEKWATKFFMAAKDILAERLVDLPEGEKPEEPNLKEISIEAYGRMFETKQTENVQKEAGIADNELTPPAEWGNDKDTDTAITDEKPLEAPETAPEPDSTLPIRPYSAEMVKSQVLGGIEKYETWLEKDPGKYAVQLEQDRKILASVIDGHFANSNLGTKARYAISEYLIGRGSTKTWSAYEVGAIKNLWLGVNAYGEVLGDVQSQELMNVWNAAQVDQGQEALL